jgi:hypothetical protein
VGVGAEGGGGRGNETAGEEDGKLADRGGGGGFAYGQEEWKRVGGGQKREDMGVGQTHVVGSPVEGDAGKLSEPVNSFIHSIVYVG